MKTDPDYIDALVRRMDPVDQSTVPDAESVEGQRVWARIDFAAATGTAAHQARPRRTRRTRRMVLPGLGAVALAVAAVVLVLQLLPNPAWRPPSSAAAALRALARSAAAQATPKLTGDQWLHSSFTASYRISDVRAGTTLVPGAVATVTATGDEWSNSLSQTCVRQHLGSPQFASPANRAAWSAAGLGLSPGWQQPGCGAGYLGRNSSLAGTLDVARLPTRPSALAKELETGTTGIFELDQMFSDSSGRLTAFGRAVLLLVGPTVGATPAFWSALLNAMATMPGVTRLGVETTHGGAPGDAFAAATGLGYSTTVILSHATGALLEVRHLDLGPNLAPSLSFARGGGAAMTAQWFDPSPPTVVDAGSLPSSLQGQVPTGIVSARTKPGTTSGQLNAWDGKAHLPDHASEAEGRLTASGGYAVSVVLYNPDPDLAAVKRLLRQSGLFTSIKAARG